MPSGKGSIQEPRRAIGHYMEVWPERAKRRRARTDSQGAGAMDSGGWNWVLLDIVAPAVLIVDLVWALLRHRASKRSEDLTERGTRDVYREEEESRRSGDDGVA